MAASASTSWSALARSCSWSLACVAVVSLPRGKLATFGGSFVLDDFARFVKMLAFGGTAAAILMSFDYRQARRACRNSNIRC